MAGVATVFDYKTCPNAKYLEMAAAITFCSTYLPINHERQLGKTAKV